MASDPDQYGKHIRQTIEAPCPRCRTSQSFGPGALSDDRTTEDRKCLECGTEITTPAYVTCRPSEADVMD